MLETIKFVLEQKGSQGEELAVLVFPAGGFSIAMVTDAVVVVSGPGFAHRVKLTGQQVIAFHEYGKDSDPRAGQASLTDTAVLPRTDLPAQ